jgi:hypothetical protein
MDFRLDRRWHAVKRLDHFEATVVLETDDCIVWPFNRNTAGYGYVIVDGAPRGVHELACEREHGPRPTGTMAIHLPGVCHTPSCYNRRHVRWGTQKENLADRLVDGTANSGERNGQAKLTWPQVDAIRRRVAAGERRAALAVEYGVHQGSIDNIVNGRKWVCPPVDGRS